LKRLERAFQRCDDPGLELSTASPLVGLDERGSSGPGEPRPAVARERAKSALGDGHFGAESGLSSTAHPALITRYSALAKMCVLGAE
jgi:hypothetical protein